MPKPRKTNVAKVRVWTERITADFEGPIAGCIRQMFVSVATDKRQALLDLLATDHQRMIDAEIKAAANPITESH